VELKFIIGDLVLFDAKEYIYLTTSLTDDISQGNVDEDKSLYTTLFHFVLKDFYDKFPAESGVWLGF